MAHVAASNSVARQQRSTAARHSHLRASDRRSLPARHRGHTDSSTLSEATTNRREPHSSSSPQHTRLLVLFLHLFDSPSTLLQDGTSTTTQLTFTIRSLFAHSAAVDNQPHAFLGKFSGFRLSEAAVSRAAATRAFVVRDGFK